MNDMEKMDLFKAALALAVADGEVKRAELGVVKGLADRLGIGQTTFETMLKFAEYGDSIADMILIKDQAKAHTSFELLVALARLDGEISVEERALLVRIAKTLKIDDADFPVIYQAGISRADQLRKSRQTPEPT